MALTRYKQKRSFKETPEPTGGKTRSKTLRFVVQKHDASHLHYDLRLEMEGVLKSWAVPKGPSMDTKVKRLAMMVEDHPYDYRSFEGIIPEGNYGAGTVIVWDEGNYAPMGATSTDKKVIDKELRHQLHAGKIKFVLNGEKLKGEFALIKSSRGGENSWLMMKLKDKYASSSDVLKKDKSVVTGKTIAQTKATTTSINGEKVKSSPAKKKVVTVKKTGAANLSIKQVAKKRKPNTSHKDIKDNKRIKSKMPSSLTPMLATLVDKPFDEAGWKYEIKWDGYRALAFVNEAQVELKSRNDKSFNDKFYPVHEALQKLGITAILDGEVVVLNKERLSDFGALQNWRSETDGELLYYLFDILWLDGKDLTELTLIERREILTQTIKEEGIIRISEQFETTGTDFYEAAKQMHLEGIMAKRADSTYRPDARSKDWLKIKTNKRQEMVIGGYTNNDDSSKPFSALLVGVWKEKELVYTGKIGTGFTDKLQREMLTKFKPLITKKIPFSSLPDINKPSRFRPDPPHAKATWLKPELVCEVSFTEMTSDGVMRHPSFQGMRIDKSSREVTLETPVAKEKIVKSDIKQKLVKTSLLKKALRPVKNNKSKTLLNPSEETQVKTISGHAIKFTNLSKWYWPEDKITKRDMLNYYYQAAPYLLPYLKDRPQSLNRFPNGIHGKSFYQKDVTGKVPDWVEMYGYHTSDEDKDKNFMVVSNEASILYIASLGAIELNPWSSRIQKPDHPDWCIIDLDPDTNSFDQVIVAAQMTKQILDDLKVPSYCKTSGSTGLHIYIPLGAKYSYEQSKEFARIVVTLVQAELPKFTSIQRATSERKGKIYLDFLQNRPKATLAAPYSLRPKPGATVSMPLHWEEVKKGLKMSDFTIHNSIDRMKSIGDIFKPVLGKGISLEKVAYSKDK